MALATIKIKDLVEQASQGRLDIPEFQRSFVWNPQQVRNLVDSLYKTYPIGPILIWDRPDYTSPKFYTDTQFPKSWIVDGQQRTTALCLLFGTKPFWWPDWQTWNELVDRNDVLVNLSKNSENLEFALSNPIRVKDPNWMSVRTILSKKEDKDLTDLAIFALKKIGGDLTANPEKFADIQSKLLRIWGIRQADLVRVEIAHEPEDVTEIFTRLNRAGTKVKEADAYVATIAAKYPGWVREEFVPFLRDTEDSGFDFEPGILIRTMTCIGQQTGQLKEVKKDFWQKENIEPAWEATKESIRTVIKHLHDYGILSADILPSKNALIPLFCLQARFMSQGFEFRKAFYWFLLATEDGRYGGSAITTLNEDVKAIYAASSFKEAISELIKPLEAKNQFDPDDFKRDYTKEDFLLLMLYLVIYQNQPRDWISKTRIGFDKSTNQLNQGFTPEWHHFFPKGRSVLKGVVPEELISSLANIVVLNERSNRMISSKSPEVYIKQLAIPKEYLAEQYVPEDPSLWTISNYSRFLDTRASILARAATKYLEDLFRD
jgi:hypothetical protein